MAELNPLDWTTIAPHFEALQAETLTLHTVDAWLRRWSDLAATLMEADVQIYREISENTIDEVADARYMRWVEDITPRVQVAEQGLKEKWLALEGYTPAPALAQHYRYTQAEADRFRADNVPLFVEITKLVSQTEKMVGGMLAEWDGQKITLPELQQKLESSDRTIRERAWKTQMACWHAIRDDMNALFLQMRTLRQRVARNAGFDNFRDYQWQVYGRFDYTPADAATFHKAIEHEIVPLATTYYQRVQERLGLDVMRPWDEKADVAGEQLIPFTHIEELEEGCGRIFDQIDPELGAYYTTMRNGWLDLAARPNKRRGGYCNNFPVSQCSYIFMNAVNNNNAVTTLIHEAGHAFHFMDSIGAHPYVWSSNAPLEFCEVASMAMELLSAPYFGKARGGFYSESHAKSAYAGLLRDNFLLFLPYMAVVDGFQHWLYAEAGDDISSDDLDAKWTELSNRFMPGVDYSGFETEKATGWHRRLHIFALPFYFIEYGLAQVGALQVWRNSLNDYPAAVATYRHALTLGGTRPIPELFAAAGTRFAFDRSTLNELGALAWDHLTTLEADTY